MNVALDLGNSYFKSGLFENNTLKEFYNSSSLTDIITYINDIRPNNVIISSVSKDEESLKSKLNYLNSCLILNSTLPVPIINAYKTPETLGKDRLAGAVGASSLFPGQNCLVIDIGTCITYDLLDSTGRYWGGGISPGINIKLKALHTFTARLPLVEAGAQEELIGRTTEESILSGVFWGTIAEINSMISMYQEKFNDLKIVVCGGDANLFESKIKQQIFVVAELVLLGLNRILQHNVSNK